MVTRSAPRSWRWAAVSINCRSKRACRLRSERRSGVQSSFDFWSAARRYFRPPGPPRYKRLDLSGLHWSGGPDDAQNWRNAEKIVRPSREAPRLIFGLLRAWPMRHAPPPELFDPAKVSLSRRLLVTLLQFLRPHHVLRPRDRCRTITPLLLVGVLPEPVHAGRSDAEISPITHFARVPGKELPQEAPSCPVPVCPPPALADLHHAHPHPSFTRRQHSAHVENPPAPHDATVLQMRKIGQF